jgi:hypothetical protein
MKLAPFCRGKARYGTFMKINRILFVFAAITIPQLTMAILAFANDEFGKVERALSVCSKVKPESTAKYLEIAKRYVGNATVKELVEARKPAEYKEAYESNGARLADLPKERVIEACSAFVKAKNIR